MCPGWANDTSNTRLERANRILDPRLSHITTRTMPMLNIRGNVSREDLSHREEC